MTSLWFIVPAHGRIDLARVCLAQLASTCRVLTKAGIDASAVVIADDENLDIASDLGFGTIERDNQQLGRKINDGYQLAGEAGVDYVAPFGNDDWLDPDLILSAPLPRLDTMRCARLSAVVNPDATRLAHLYIPYDGGDGVRIIPTALLKPFRFRPAGEDTARALDTAVWMRLRPRIEYHDLHGLQIIDWKSHESQLNDYDGCLQFATDETDDFWTSLAFYYPAEAIAGMRALHGLVAA